MAERIPPHNEEAERSVLGAVMLNREVLFDVLEQVKEDDFYNSSNKEIFAAILELYKENKAVDVLTVSEELKKRGVLQMVGGRAYVAQLTLDVPSTVNAAEYAKIVSEKAGKRLVWSEERGDFEEKPVVSPDRLSGFSLGEALTIQLRRNPILTRLLGYNKYCFYKDMPTGNAEKNNDVRNVRFFDLADAYRKKQSVRAEKPVEEKATMQSDKSIGKMNDFRPEDKTESRKKKPKGMTGFVSGFKDLKAESIDERKES